MSAPPQNSEPEKIEATVEENRNQESICNKTLEKGKEKERTEKDLEETVLKQVVCGYQKLTHPEIFINTSREE